MNPPPLPVTRPKITRAKARNAALINQLATPGLGSLLAGRWISGTGQLLLAVIGVGLVFAWFVLLMAQVYQAAVSDVPPRSIGLLGAAGALVFVAGWIWSLFTSLSLLREARQSDNGIDGLRGP